MTISVESIAETQKVEEILGEAQAASGAGWYDCVVSQVGPAEDSNIYIILKDRNGAFNSWFKAYDAVEKDMLSVALTAITTTLPVFVLLSGTAPYQTIYRMYVHR